MEHIRIITGGPKFWFGGAVFVKESNTNDELVACMVGNTSAMVYISTSAVVGLTPGADADLRQRSESYLSALGKSSFW